MTREEQIVEAGKTAAEGKEFSVLVNKQRRTMSAYEIGFIEGAEWADSHPAWVSVEDRLPKRMSEKSRFSETVLVYNKEGFNDTAYYDYEEKIWRWLPGVTHWMPLPTPPEKGGRG